MFIINHYSYLLADTLSDLSQELFVNNYVCMLFMQSFISSFVVIMKGWLILILIRILWTLYGQQGYIHPDEFFQSTEVLYGAFYVTKNIL